MAKKYSIAAWSLVLLLGIGFVGTGANLYAQDDTGVMADTDRDDTSADWGLLGLLGLAGLMGLRRREHVHERDVRATTAVPTR